MKKLTTSNREKWEVVLIMMASSTLRTSFEVWNYSLGYEPEAKIVVLFLYTALIFLQL
jgi:hypothetical protein